MSDVKLLAYADPSVKSAKPGWSKAAILSVVLGVLSGPAAVGLLVITILVHKAVPLPDEVVKVAAATGLFAPQFGAWFAGAVALKETDKSSRKPLRGRRLAQIGRAAAALWTLTMCIWSDHGISISR